MWVTKHELSLLLVLFVASSREIFLWVLWSKKISQIAVLDEELFRGYATTR